MLRATSTVDGGYDHNREHDVLSRYFDELRTRQEEAAIELRTYVESEAREMTSENFTKYMELVTGRIFDLVNSSDQSEKMGGIMVIDELIDVAYEENETKIIRFANYLRMVFQQSGDSSDARLLKKAAKALGHLARTSGGLATEIVEFEVKRALEWLEGDRSEQRRHAAVLVLKELAENTPTLFNVYAGNFLEHIWVTLRDPKLQIREAAVEALRACLVLIAKRISRTRAQRYYKIFVEVQQGFKTGSVEAVHGSLLVIGELLANSGDFMLARFKEVCETVLKYKDHKDKMVRDTVVTLLPKLAAFEKEAFVRGYLETCLTHIITALKSNTTTRGTSYVALGEMAVAVGSDIPQLDTIVALIKDGLTTKAQQPFTHKALTCLSMVARAVGPKLMPHMKDLIDQMFLNGLSPPLVEALTEVSTHIPAFLPPIQERLLATTSGILSPAVAAAGIGAGSTPRASVYRGPDKRAPSISLQGKININVSGDDSHGAHAPSDPHNAAALVSLALGTLGTFNFDSHNLLPFVREVVLNYLDDENPMIRKQAAFTCSRVLLWRPTTNAPALLLGGSAENKDGTVVDDVLTSRKVLSVGTQGMICEVLERLLTAGIADPDPAIRRTVLESLDPRFDDFLAQTENLHSLFVALNDEVFAIREAAISVIGRLALRNPAYVMPLLRKTLIQLLTELQYSGDTRSREESSILLGHLIASSQRLIKPYIHPILKVLVPRLSDADSGVASCVLATLGKLAEIGAEDMDQHLNELLPIIIGTLNDKSSIVKREVALRTLGQLVESTGYVVDPYFKFPSLLPACLAILKGGQGWPVRREVIKVLGIVGALDPYKDKVNQLKANEAKEATKGSQPSGKGSVESSEEKVAVGEGSSAAAANTMMIGLSQSSDEYYPTVAIHALMRILREPALTQHHNKVIQAVVFIFRSLGLKCVPFLPAIVPPMLDLVRSHEDALRETLFTHLGILVSIVKQHIKPYLPGIIELIQANWDDPSLLEQILNLAEKISIVLREEFKMYLPDLLPHMLSVFHSDRTQLRMPTLRVLRTLEVLGINLDEYMHLVIPGVMRLCEQVDAPFSVRQAALHALCSLCLELNVTDYASRILHPLARVLDATPLPSASKAAAVPLRSETMDALCVVVFQLKSSFAIFIPMFAKILQRQTIQDDRYDVLVDKVLKNTNITRSDIAFASDRARHNTTAWEAKDNSNTPSSPAPAGMEAGGANGDGGIDVKKLRVNQPNLKKAWETSQRSTKDDWAEWVRAFSIELLKESPSPALRACSILAQKYHPLARDLFNAAFLSCWTELYDQYQDDLIHALETAFKSPTIPPDLLQTLLNLAEFMEHDDKRLPIDIRTLGALAERCHAYAKALHYKELEFQLSPSSTIEALISVNNQLQQPEAAVGILKYAKEQHAVELKESWYEKLQRWEDALEAYEKKQLEVLPTTLDVSLGRMRSLRALGEWERLAVLAHDMWNRNPEKNARKEIAPLAAAANWNLGRWDFMEQYLGAMDGVPEGKFFNAILAVHKGEFVEARRYIDKSRELLDTELTALVGESYNRAYRLVVQVQQMTELEEVIRYKETKDPAQKALIRRMWSTRLQGCQENVDVWQSILAVRSLVVSPQEDIPTWLRFSSLCRKNGRQALSLNILTTKLGISPENKTSSNPFVCFAYYKHLWAAGFQQEALDKLGELVKIIETKPVSPIELVSSSNSSLSSAIAVSIASANSSSNFSNSTGTSDWKTPSTPRVGAINSSSSTSTSSSTLPKVLSNLSLTGTLNASAFGTAASSALASASSTAAASALGGGVDDNADLIKLKAKCYLRLGEWQIAINNDQLTNESIPIILAAYQNATTYDHDSYKVWHNWAVMNFRVISHCAQQKTAAVAAKNKPEADRLETKLNSHLVPAVKGFFRSVALAGDQSLQDILRLLSLWFNYGNQPQVEKALVDGFNTISIDTWLSVIPQIIARLHTKLPTVRSLIIELLTRIGKVHPQALVYELTVASKSSASARQTAANQVTNNIRKHSSTLVEQASTVASELIRVAILWHEMWHEALEEASRQWFAQHNVEGMIATLMPLHDMMSKGPDTLREVAFLQNYGRDLAEALEWTQKYQRSKAESDLNQAWDLYCNVFRKINKQLNQLTDLELQYVSPRLHQLRNFELAVPGTYLDDFSPRVSTVKTIAYFIPSLKVIESKQRPRKLAIMGSDGQEYAFLLKGHEDLRQDKRVMQLFGLVNTLLANDTDTAKKDLRIRGYSVIPLAPNSGLISWLSNCDTMHALIKDYRDARKVLLNIEHRLMLQMAPDYQLLSLIQKVEVFEHALARTTGQDLQEVLWLKSPNSEVWLDRRTNYTRSLAVMSMVGYILGLGDRHPCNLMLDRFSGKIIHIDFGDCFEVAMDRDKFPERIPFRLTRMLINAMEVSGIEGNFRSTCESVMRVLRENKESVMAVLEAFVYDPLINWRLLKGGAKIHGETTEEGKVAQPEIKLEADSIAQSMMAASTLKDTEFDSGTDEDPNSDVLNAKALSVVGRVESKLTGKDFGAGVLDVPAQVEKLIREATSHSNLCQCYIGWCPFW